MTGHRGANASKTLNVIQKTLEFGLVSTISQIIEFNIEI